MFLYYSDTASAILLCPSPISFSALMTAATEYFVTYHNNRKP
nr:MAG TPA: hypothetical protein [Caudoviricetes sp.]